MQVSVFDIATRFEENPLVTPQGMKPSSEGMIVESLINPGVFRFDKKIWLVVRVVERPEQIEGSVSVPEYDEEGEIEILQFDKTDPDLDLHDPRMIHYKGKAYPATLSHMRLMCSDDGKEFSAPKEFKHIFGHGELEAFGIEDCRVAEINGIFYVTYNMQSSLGCAVGLMQTRDWKRFERKGMILPPQNRDCVIFEEKIRDKYYALHRPASPEPGGNHIWLAESPDSVHWGRHKCIATTRRNMWDSERIGAGGSPIQTPKGWLVIYHGADDQHRYCLGAMLLDIRDPDIVIARSATPFMEPSESYELNGHSGNVIFTSGHLVKGDKLSLYYGAGDEAICGAELSVHEILDSLSPEKK
jgi:beta-1,2-mannobiose phosphorylase / 1,2-beta-oligomannan phosphorylase